MLKIKHQRTADCVVAGFRWHKNGPGHARRLAAARPVRRRGQAPPRRHHVVVHVGPARRAGRGAGAAPRERRSRATRGRSGPSGPAAGDADASGPAAARRDVALEPRQGPVVGAAPRRAGRRGRLRPPPGRPLPPRDDVQALAPRQAAGGLPLRPARDDRAVRARGDLRRADGRLRLRPGLRDLRPAVGRGGPRALPQGRAGRVHAAAPRPDHVPAASAGPACSTSASGIGVIDHELLREGAGHAVLVDASPPSLEAARNEARRRGHLDRVDFVDGDFVVARVVDRCGRHRDAGPGRVLLSGHGVAGPAVGDTARSRCTASSCRATAR